MTDALFDTQTPAAEVTSPRASAAGHEPGRTVDREESTARPVLEIHVLGLPAPQGSKRGFVNPHTGRVAMVESSKKVKPWREAVKHAAFDVVGQREGTGDPFAILGEALYVETTFTMPRPKSHYRTGRNAHLLRDNAPAWPAGKPDEEKLTRSTRDALTDAGVWTDDCLVVRAKTTKSYPGGCPDALPVPGAVIRIYLMGDRS
jgi:Holliday junction resolvase RusA-like endonuclease